MHNADLAFVGGKIITVNPEQPRAKAIAIENGRFASVGSNEQILSYISRDTVKIDLKGKTVIPGFFDTHVHGMSLGRLSSQIELRNAESIREVQRKVRHWTKKTPRGEWIIGRGWSQDKFTEHRYLTSSDLDQAAPNHPVFLLRVCGHLGVANTSAMKLAGIKRESKAPEGGLIDKDPETGEPNGILRENALDLIHNVLPENAGQSALDVCLSACQRMVQEGISTVHWILSSAKEAHTLQDLNEQNLLPLRVYAMYPIEQLDNLIELGLSTGFGNDKIKIGGVKLLMDGSLGARTAALREPYSDEPETRGMLLYSQEQLESLVEKAHKANIQMAIHAIGDRTLSIVLRILEKVLQRTPVENQRHRIEHASVLTPGLIKKMKEINVIASVQPHFIISDFWVEDRLGPARARWAYAIRSLLKEGVITMGGSDAPVEPASPILGIYAAVARRSFPQERLTFEEALRLYTINAAYGSFEEGTKGSIEVGKLADLVVLSEDPCKTTPQQIKDIKVDMTIVGGNIVYNRNSHSTNAQLSQVSRTRSDDTQ